MKITKSNRGRPSRSKSRVPAGPRRKAKAAEAARDPKITAPVAAPADAQAPESKSPEAKPADKRPEAAKPAAAPEKAAKASPEPAKRRSAAKSAAPATKTTPKSAKAPAKRAAAKAAAPAAKVTRPAPAPVARTAPAPDPVRELARVVQATTAEAAKAAKPAADTLAAARAAAPAAMRTGVEGMGRVYAGLQGNGETMSRAMTETAASTARGLAEFNGKMLELFRAQSDAAFGVWRATLTAGSLAEAVRAQTSGLHRMYETSVVQWKDVAEAATRLVGEAAKPMQSVWPNRRG
jgi:hypothetical protein